MNSRNSCIILAGGLGTRLRSVTRDLPKCLAPICGKPFLYWQIKWLMENGMDRIILALGYGSIHVISEISKLFPGSPRIEFSVEHNPIGTGGAILKCMREFHLQEVLAINGDTIVTADLERFKTPLRSCESEYVRVGVVSVKEVGRYGSIVLGSGGKILGFEEKTADGPGLINAGIYRLDAAVFRGLGESGFSFEKDVLPNVCSRAGAYSALLDGEFIDIGVPNDYKMLCDNFDRFCRLR